MAIKQTKCPDCGAIVGADRNVCPECGCPITHESTPPSQPATTMSEEAHTVSHHTNRPIQPTPMPIPFFQADWAQYFYECGVIGWEAFKKYACFTGRASRREFWSFNLICWLVGGFTGGLAAFILLLPMIGVGIRRMHDIGKCGWWCICPIACIFLFLKRSDEGVNQYGSPNPAINLL